MYVISYVYIYLISAFRYSKVQQQESSFDLEAKFM